MIIGIGGELESGKSTVAGIIVKKYGFVEKSFAKNLKDMVMFVFGFSDYQVNHTEGKKALLDQPVVLRQAHLDAIVTWARDVNGIIATAAMQDKMAKHIGTVLPTSRKVLQFVGTEILRECINDSYHINVVLREIQLEGCTKVVVSDARFANERAWIKGLKGSTVLSFNPHAPVAPPSAHQSEQVGNPEDYDFTIINDKNLGYTVLKRQIHLIMHMLEFASAVGHYEDLKTTKEV